MSLQQQYDGLMEHLHTIYSKDDIFDMCTMAQLGEQKTIENVIISQVTKAYGD